MICILSDFKERLVYSMIIGRYIDAMYGIGVGDVDLERHLDGGYS